MAFGKNSVLTLKATGLIEGENMSSTSFIQMPQFHIRCAHFHFFFFELISIVNRELQYFMAHFSVKQPFSRTKNKYRVYLNGFNCKNSKESSLFRSLF